MEEFEDLGGPSRPAMQLLRSAQLYCYECFALVDVQPMDQHNLRNVVHPVNDKCSDSGREQITYLTQIYEKIFV